MSTVANPNHPPIITHKLLVGLTGGIGSGKTSVANAFGERGAVIIDADAISHRLTAPHGAAIPAIREAFGADIITPQGALDRAKMRQRVFADATLKSRLEAILHPMIRAEAVRQTSVANGVYIIYVIPLLVETGQQEFSRILVVDCEEATQIQRVMQRDGLNEQMVLAIMAGQATRQQRLAAATDVIHNQSTLDALTPEIDRLHKLYCRLSSPN